MCATIAALTIHVVPDHPNIINCPSQPCTTLDDLLPNNSLSNISNVEFKLLPRVYNVTSTIKIECVHNVSLIGVVYKSMSIVLKCFYRVSLQVICSYNVTISNLVFEQCGGYSNWLLSDYDTACKDDGMLSPYYAPSIYITHCEDTLIHNITIQDHIEYGIIGYNMVRMSHLNFITAYSRNETSWGILLLYDDGRYTESYYFQNNTILVTALSVSTNSLVHYAFGNKAIRIEMMQAKYVVTVILRDSVFANHITVDQFIKVDKRYNHGLSTRSNNILLKNLMFKHNKQGGISFKSLVEIKMGGYVTITLLNCTFYMNKYTVPLVVIIYSDDNLERFKRMHTNAVFINVTFESNLYCPLLFCYASLPATKIKYVMNIHFTGLLINGTNSLLRNHLIYIENRVIHVHFKENNIISNNYGGYIITIVSSLVTFSGNMTFVGNECFTLINLKSAYTYISVMEYSTILFELNSCNQLITVENDDTLYPYCLFQYITPIVKTMSLRQFFQLYNIRVISNYPNEAPSTAIVYYTSHCRWLSATTFYGYNPGVINANIIHIADPIKQGLQLNKHTNICYCSQNGTYNCTTDILGHVYPGQTLQAGLCAPFITATEGSLIHIETHSFVIKNVTCKIAHQAELTAEVGKQYTQIIFTIVSNRTDQCSLFLTAQPDLYKYYDVFLVQLLPCPIGFTLLNGMCDCDPYLVNSDLQINTCYINEVAIQRPANSWIGYNNHSGEMKYFMCSTCPMDYCSPSTTKLNLEHPDSQCQFHRTGLLCSQCQNGLSMIFGSSRCMRCTNVYLLLSIVVLIAGVVLVVLLYCLNLTVTKGTINGIIFYANIISINGSVFLVNDNVYKPLKVFIFFTNLDLDIETCFYNGMDSYAKMWLQLFFPFYLIMMATLLIITSRYSTRIQRLTFTRSLPVLATLFLLSYTGILRNVSTVLFSYSTITELPSNHQHLVWSIDASVPLFGAKFAILFITCLILFVMLIPFNMTLLFTRYVMRFRIINRFKPLLDTFQGSYKHKHYFWIAVYVIIINMFFVLNIVVADVRLLVGTVILIPLLSFYGYICPHKSIFVNIQEYLLLINVTIIYSASYHCSDTISSTITNVMITIALVHFTIILLYHFLTFTCHCNVENMLWDVKEKMIKCCHLKLYTHHREDTMSCEIPELTRGGSRVWKEGGHLAEKS